MANSSNTSDNNSEMEWLDLDIAVVFLVLNMIMCFANEFLLFLLIKMLQRQEDLFIGKLLGCYGKFNMVCTPVVLVLLYGVIGLVPISTIAVDWFCGITTFVYYFWSYFNNNFSFIVVCLLYVCLLRGNHGKQFVIDLFCALSFFLPLIGALMSVTITVHQSPYDLVWAYKCYGTKLDLDAEFCSFDETLLDQKYGEWSDVVKPCLHIVCWIDFVWTLILSSNILEALIYCLIYSHLTRYVYL